MAFTVTRVGNPTVFGDKRVVFADVAFDNSYPTGGLALSGATLGLVGAVQFLDANAALGRTFAYDYANSKVKAFTTSTGVEVANAVDLSAVVTRIIAVGV